jgi:hypothetical protein
MCKVLTREVNGLVVAVEQESISAAHAARKLMKLYKIKDERDLLVEHKDLKFADPLRRFQNDHYDDRKQRIVINDEWVLADFKAFAAWLAAPAKQVPVQKAPEPRRRNEGHSVRRGREKHLQYVAAHS